MKKLLLFICLLTMVAFAGLRPSNMRDLPEYMESYKNYLIILVHGMNSDETVWDSTGFKNSLCDLMDDADFAKHVFVYSFDNIHAGYEQNALEIGGPKNTNNWLNRARKDFIKIQRSVFLCVDYYIRNP